MIGNFSEEAQNILNDAKKEMQDLKHPYIGTEHLMLAMLKDKELSILLKEYNLTYEIFKEKIIKQIGYGESNTKIYIYTPLLKKVIENAILESKDNNKSLVTSNHLLISLLDISEGIAIRTFASMNIDIEGMYNKISSKKEYHKKNKKLLINEFGVDLTKKAINNELDPVIGREKEVQRLIEILSRRTKNNPILIGKAGVGKTAIVEELSRLIAQKKVPDKLLGKKIISVDMASLVAGTKYRGEFEDRMRKIISEIESNEEIIIFIDEIHTLMGAGGAEGAIDASNILKPALSRGKIRCIGATTIEEYRSSISKDSALERRFQKIIIEEPSNEEMIKILQKLKPIYESYHNVKITNKIIRDIVELSNRYIYDRYFPDKAIDILDEACARVSIRESKQTKIVQEIKNSLEEVTIDKNNFIIENKIDKAYLSRKKEKYLQEKLMTYSSLKPSQKIVSISDVAQVIHTKTQIPVYEIIKDNEKTIKKIKDVLTKNIIGEDKAISKLIDLTKKIKSGYKDNKCFSIMMRGPSGVGKTALATLYGKILVGEKNVIRLDMSEYSESVSVNKIIGSAPGYVGYDDNKNFLEQIKLKPNAVIILDEIDKANQTVINLFYQILEEGEIRDSKSNLISLRNNIIIMTTNSGYENNKLGFSSQNDEYLNASLKESFSIPFVNRIDMIINFEPLTKENIIKIIENKYRLLNKKYSGIKITFTNQLTEEIIEESNYKEYGARQISKIISNKIENIIIDALENNQKEITISSLTIKS